jgi:hypothetical protein
MLIKYNDFLNTSDMEYINSIASSKGWAWGHSSTENSLNYFWIYDNLEADSFFNEYLFNKIKQLTNDNLILERVYLNGHTASSEGSPHQDSKDPNGRTFLVYCNDVWKSEYGGGTAFLAEDEVATIAFKPKAAIYFQNNIFHHAAPVSKNFSGLRVTLAFKMKVVSA